MSDAGHGYEPNTAFVERMHARHVDSAKFYEISSVLLPGKSESLDPADRVYWKACEACGYRVSQVGVPFEKA